jgi:hypothetical protein
MNGPDIFTERGIKPEVVASRPYVRWTTGNHKPLEDAWHPHLERERRPFVTKIANQSGGYVITRHPPPRFGLGPIAAEIRPDAPVITSMLRDGHDHAKVRAYRRSSELLAEHLRKKHGPEDPVRLGKEASFIDGGRNVEGWHAHPAKYVFCPSPRVEKDGRWVKGKGSAQRLDVHPHAVALLEEADRVFFGIEGCLKADAILSRGEAVFSVPSVTCWDAPELEDFARAYLTGRTVYIVPDADWYDNPLVLCQAMLCRSFLRERGINAWVAAPPSDPKDVKGNPVYKGVDDFLGTPKFGVDGLDVIGREAPPAIEEWAQEQPGRVDGARRNADLLQVLSLHARRGDGTIYKSIPTLSRLMRASGREMSKRTVHRALDDLLESPGLTSPRALWVVEDDEGNRGSTDLHEPMKVRTRSGHEYWTPVDWEEDRPTLKIASEFRAIEPELRRVGDGVPEGEQFVLRDLSELAVAKAKIRKVRDATAVRRAA